MNPINWEIYVLPNPTQSQLTALGQQGWELVTVTALVSGLVASEKAYFKRPKPVTTVTVAPGK